MIISDRMLTEIGQQVLYLQYKLFFHENYDKSSLQSC